MTNTRDKSPAKVPNPKINAANRVAKNAAVPQRSHASGSAFSLNASPATVSVRVGPLQKEFVFHEAILCNESTFFRGCFQGRGGQVFREGITKVCPLEQTDPIVFSYVFEYVYTQNIKQVGDLKGKDAAPDSLMLIEIWKLADFLGMLGLMDYTMNKLNDAYSQTDPRATASDILHLVLPCYEGTVENASVRTWISDVFALGLGDFEKSLTKDELRNLTCSDFLLDVFYARAKYADAREIKPLTAASDHRRKAYSYPATRYHAVSSGHRSGTRSEVIKTREKKALKDSQAPPPPNPRP